MACIVCSEKQKKDIKNNDEIAELFQNVSIIAREGAKFLHKHNFNTTFITNEVELRKLERYNERVSKAADSFLKIIRMLSDNGYEVVHKKDRTSKLPIDWNSYFVLWGCEIQEGTSDSKHTHWRAICWLENEITKMIKKNQHINIDNIFNLCRCRAVAQKNLDLDKKINKLNEHINLTNEKFKKDVEKFILDRYFIYKNYDYSHVEAERYKLNNFKDSRGDFLFSISKESQKSTGKKTFAALLSLLENSNTELKTHTLLSTISTIEKCEKKCEEEIKKNLSDPLSIGGAVILPAPKSSAVYKVSSMDSLIIFYNYNKTKYTEAVKLSTIFEVSGNSSKNFNIQSLKLRSHILSYLINNWGGKVHFDTLLVDMANFGIKSHQILVCNNLKSSMETIEKQEGVSIVNYVDKNKSGIWSGNQYINSPKLVADNDVRDAFYCTIALINHEKYKQVLIVGKVTSNARLSRRTENIEFISNDEVNYITRIRPRKYLVDNSKGSIKCRLIAPLFWVDGAGAELEKIFLKRMNGLGYSSLQLFSESERFYELFKFDDNFDYIQEINYCIQEIKSEDNNKEPSKRRKITLYPFDR